MTNVFAERLKRLKAGLKDRGLDAMVVQDRVNSLYLSGFRSSYSIVVVDDRGATFITDSRYGEAAEKAVSGHRKVVVQPTTRVREFLQGLMSKRGYKNAGYEGSISVDELDAMKKWTRGIKLVRAGELLMSLRRVKDALELKAIRRAVALADELMEHAIGLLAPGITEAGLSQSVRFHAEILGGSGESFSNIIGGGPNTSRPHHHPGTRRFRKNEPVTIDLGVIHDGYCSDLTRTPVLGKPSAKFARIYEVCLAANEAAIKGLRPGMTGVEVDKIARDVITEAGFGQYFGHGLGHGVGLEIHEEPRLSPRAGDYKLEPGNIVTIEPGIYLPGECGVRIEDYAVVTKSGAQVLSKSPKGLRLIPC